MFAIPGLIVDFFITNNESKYELLFIIIFSNAFTKILISEINLFKRWIKCPY